MTATVIKMSIQRMVCTGRGAEANASCNCGVPYQPKSVRAAEAIKASPEKSDRAIAAELGIAKNTVRASRQELVSADQLEDGPRTGIDGVTRRLPEKKSRKRPRDNFETARRLRDDHEREMERAEARAEELIGKFGLSTLKEIFEAVADDPYVCMAVRRVLNDEDDIAATAERRKPMNAAPAEGETCNTEPMKLTMAENGDTIYVLADGIRVGKRSRRSKYWKKLLRGVMIVTLDEKMARETGGNVGDPMVTNPHPCYSIAQLAEMLGPAETGAPDADEVRQ